jgi:allantoinase
MPDHTSIYSERCWYEGKLQPATVHFLNGIITAVDPCFIEGAIHAGNDILMPGVIDAHVHVNEPGRTDWEGFETATMAAAAGGITLFADMPLNASPVTTNVKAFLEKVSSAEGKLHVHVALYGGLIPGNLNDLEPLMRSGVSGIKCFLVHSGIDEFPNVSEKDMDEAMPLIAKHHLPLLAHCEMYSAEVETGLSAHPGSYQRYLASRPKKWENDAVALMIRLCRKYHCPVHIVHVSSAEALPLIADAKREGLPVTAETCSHYIYFDAEHIPDNDTLYKCAPPIREKENNRLLKQALIDGTLDFITTDHSPAPPDIKELLSGNLDKAWGGIAGLQFLLPASWTALKDTMTAEQFIPLVTSNPARFLQAERKGEIKPGHDADFVIWSPEERFRVTMDSILHRHKNSPYTGRELFGVVKSTIVGGSMVFEHFQLSTSGHMGKIIYPAGKVIV